MALPKKIAVGLAVALSLLGLYGLLGFYLLPAYLQNNLPRLLTEALAQPVTLRAVRLDPFDLSAEIDGFGLSLESGPLLSFDNLAVDVAVWQSLVNRMLVVESVVLKQPQLTVEQYPKGQFNFAALQKKPSTNEEKSPAAMPMLLLHRLMIEQGQVNWADKREALEHSETLQPIDLTVNELATGGEQAAGFELSLTINSGGRLHWQGDLSLLPLASKGEWLLEGLALSPIWQNFLHDVLPLRLSEGQAKLQGRYAFSHSEQGLSANIDDATLLIEKLALVEKDTDAALLSMAALQVEGIDVDLGKRLLAIDRVSSRDASVKAWLQADGRLNYQALFARPSEQPAEVSAPPAANVAASPWRVKLDAVSLDGYQLRFTDLTQKKPLELGIDELAIQLMRFDTQEGGLLPLQLAGKLKHGGYLKADGQIRLSPFSTDLTLDVGGIELKSFQNYVDPFLNLELVDGDLSIVGKLQAEASEPLQLQYHGGARIDHLITRDKVKNKDFVKWTALGLDDIAVDLGKQDFKIGHVLFDQPYVRITIKKEGGSNIDDILPHAAQQPAASKSNPKAKLKAASADSGPLVTIGKIEFKDGMSDFADYSLFLPFATQMKYLQGSISEFSTRKHSPSKLALTGKVYDLAPVTISGQHQLDSGDSDIDLKFNNLPLPLVTPYMAEFAGYKIEKGQMALDLHYKVKDRQLEAQNSIRIDQLELGEHVDNPKAPSLPLHLAVALLKDMDGRIKLDFPIAGSLEDPKFSVGHLIGDVLTNMVTKVVASPFKLVASMFDSEKDFSAIAFNAGSADLSADAVDSLDKISQTLKAKPELVLEVKGAAYQALDWSAMRFGQVVDILKKMKSGELRDKGERIRHEYIELDDAEYKRLLAKFYAEVYPDRIERSLLGKPRIKNQPDGDFYSLAREQLEEAMRPELQKLNELAVARANRIATFVNQNGGIEHERLFVLATEVDTGEQAKANLSRLSLNVAH